MPPKRGRPSKADAAKRDATTSVTSTRPKRTAANIKADEPGRSAKKAKIALEEGAIPTKRGRGRPPKSEAPAKASTSTGVEKRGRGRPPKSAASGSVKQVNAQSVQPKRGRKTQVPNTSAGHQQHTSNHRAKAAYAPEELPLGEQTNQEEANEQLQGEAMAAEPSAKRGRGRPKKAGSQLLADMGVELPPKPKDEGDDSKGTGKKRGRPRSDKLTEALATSIEDVEEEQRSKRAKTSKQQDILDKANEQAKGGKGKTAGTESVQDPDPPAKRGRGRPPKASTAAQPTNSASKAKATKAATTRANEAADGDAPEDKYVDEHGRHLWLMKAEPETRFENGKDVKFSIDDLAACTVPEPWSGVRNPVARNNMKAMKTGDLALFYHSNAKKLTGVAGIMEIVGEATPDLTAFDKEDPYYDEKSNEANPKWYNVHVEFRSKLPKLITLPELKSAKGLEEMVVLKQSRLSVTKVTKKEWDTILDLAGADNIPPSTASITGAVAKPVVTAASTMAAAIKGMADAVGETISDATTTAAAVMSAAVKSATGDTDHAEEGLDVADSLPTTKNRASSAQPSSLKEADQSSGKRATSAQPGYGDGLESVEEDFLA